MDVISAADICRSKIIENGGMTWGDLEPMFDQPISIGHVIEMCDKIVGEEIQGEKAHRWLGWIQACMFMGRVGTLEELKQMNRIA